MLSIRPKWRSRARLSPPLDGRRNDPPAASPCEAGRADLLCAALRDEERTAAFLALLLMGWTAAFEDADLAADGAEPAERRSDSGRLRRRRCRQVDSSG